MESRLLFYRFSADTLTARCYIRINAADIRIVLRFRVAIWILGFISDMFSKITSSLECIEFLNLSNYVLYKVFFCCVKIIFQIDIFCKESYKVGDQSKLC